MDSEFPCCWESRVMLRWRSVLADRYIRDTYAKMKWPGKQCTAQTSKLCEHWRRKVRSGEGECAARNVAPSTVLRSSGRLTLIMTIAHLDQQNYNIPFRSATRSPKIPPSRIPNHLHHPLKRSFPTFPLPVSQPTDRATPRKMTR